MTACRHCHAHVIATIDDVGIEVTLDPAPLTVRGECLAVIAGRATFQRIPASKRSAAETWHRNAFSIGQPARYGDLLCAHVCGKPPPPEWLAPPPDHIVITHQPNPEGEPEW